MTKISPTAASGHTSALAKQPEIKTLNGLLKKRSLTLRHRHRVGDLLRRLSANPNVAERGNGWRRKVAKILGVSEEKLNKCFQFRSEYEKIELPQLKKLKIRWTMLTIALAVEGKRRRLALLRKAKVEGWTQRRLRWEVQRINGGCRGGGRPRTPLTTQGCVADLGELNRLAWQVNEFLADVWSPQQVAYEAEFLRAPRQAKETIGRDLGAAAKQLKDLVKNAQGALSVVKALAGNVAGPQK
jgi:hypothetical protein